MNDNSAEQKATMDLRQAIAMRTGKAVELWLHVVPGPADRNRQVASLSSAEIGSLGEYLDRATGRDLFGTLDEELVGRTVCAMAPDRAAEVLDTLDSDRAAAIMRDVDESVREAVLTLLPLPRAKILRGLLSWPQDSVAAHMVPEALTVRPGATASAAVDALRGDAARLHTDSRTSTYVYVTDDDARLLGVVAFRDLVLAAPNRPVAELTVGDPVTVSALTDAEVAAQDLIDRDLLALPVVDADGRLLGLFTEDAAADIAEEAATEDAERQGGSEPLEVPYLRASPIRLWRKRIVWLLALFVAEAYTGTVLRAFEDEMEAVVALAFFIPLLIGTGGNVGTQITTTLVRAMATAQIRFRDLPAILAKEMSTGSLIALAMAGAALIRAWTLGVGPEVTLTVTLTVAAIVLWSSFVASILPPTLKKLGVDPAVVSAPMIATVVDGTGLLIYFVIAHLTLPQLSGL